MRQDERNNERAGNGNGGADRDAHHRRFSEDEFDRTWDREGRDAETAADGAYGESGRYRAEQRGQQRTRREAGHDDGWGDNREGYDSPGRYGVRGSNHEGRGGFTQDRAEEGSGGYSQSWAEFGFQGGWPGNPRREPEYRRDEYEPRGGESWPGYQLNEGIGGMSSGGDHASARPTERGASRGPHAGRGPKGYRRAIERITEDVCEALTRHPHVDAREIEIRVEGSEVTLTGSVDSRAAKRAAEDAAEECSGVDNVINQLRVSTSDRKDRSPRDDG